jgi:hypothetical protein
MYQSNYTKNILLTLITIIMTANTSCTGHPKVATRKPLKMENLDFTTQITDTIKIDFKEILLKDEWVTNYILGLDSITEIYELNKFNKKDKFAGNITRFTDSVNYISQYTAWCGNDNFTQVYGQYKFLENNKITICAIKTTYSGEWTRPTEHREVNYLIFEISMVDDTIIFTRQK